MAPASPLPLPTTRHLVADQHAAPVRSNTFGGDPTTVQCAPASVVVTTALPPTAKHAVVLEQLTALSAPTVPCAVATCWAAAVPDPATSPAPATNNAALARSVARSQEGRMTGKCVPPRRHRQSV